MDSTQWSESKGVYGVSRTDLLPPTTTVRARRQIGDTHCFQRSLKSSSSCSYLPFWWGQVTKRLQPIGPGKPRTRGRAGILSSSSVVFVRVSKCEDTVWCSVRFLWPINADYCVFLHRESVCTEKPRILSTKRTVPVRNRAESGISTPSQEQRSY